MGFFDAIQGWSLRKKAFVLLVLASGVPPLAVAGLLLQRERAMRRDENVAVLRARVDEVGHTLEALSRGYISAAERGAADPDFLGFCAAAETQRDQLRASVQYRLSIMKSSDPGILGLGIIDAEGVTIASTVSAMVGKNLGFRDYFMDAMAGKEVPELYVSVPAVELTPLVAFPAPMARGGRVIGAYVVYVDAKALWEVMRAANDLAGPGSYFILFDRYRIRIGDSANPALLYHPAEPLAPEVVRSITRSRRFQEKTAEFLSQVEPVPAEAFGASESRILRWVSPTNGLWNLGVARNFPIPEWTLVATVPERELEVGFTALIPKVVPATLLGLVLALTGGALLMRHIVEPIRTLAGAAEALSRGEFCETLATPSGSGSDEISALERSFRSMAAVIAERDRSLRAGNRDLRQVLDSVEEGFLAADPDGTISGVHSTVTESWFGPVQPGMHLWEYLSQDDQTFTAALQERWKGLGQPGRSIDEAIARLPARFERGKMTFDLAYRSVQVQGRLERVILVITDVTGVLARQIAERQLEAELRQAQKLEAVGHIAAGIAHELNTPIQYVGDGTRFVKEAFSSVTDVLRVHQQVLSSVPIASEAEARLRDASEKADLGYLLEEVPKALGQVLEGVQRVSTIVRAMKEFAHPDQKEKVPTDLNRALAATLEISRNEYKYVADVCTDFGQIPEVVCHAGDLNQVFLNIIVNAAHAIGDVVRGTGAKGVIRVRTSVEDGLVVVAISDTGGGIPPEIQDKIYEPFFTTKPVGKGTGQGLAIARSVVRNHSGQLSFVSEQGKGTTFFVRLPV